MKVNMEHWWNDTDRGKPQYWEENLSECHSIQHKSHMNWHRVETGSPRWDVNHNYNSRLTSHRAVNTLRTGYISQPVNAVQRNNSCCPEIHTKYVNKPCGQNVGFFNVKPSGIYTNHKALNSWIYPSDFTSRVPCLYLEDWQDLCSYTVVATTRGGPFVHQRQWVRERERERAREREATLISLRILSSSALPKDHIDFTTSPSHCSGRPALCRLSHSSATCCSCRFVMARQ
jgi:hypothetical protein